MGARPVLTDDEGLHETEKEQLRIGDLLRLIPPRGQSLLDVGARDGYLSRLCVDRFNRIVALDLVKPVVHDPRVEAVAGDARALPYPDNSFDVVVCAEVLEHIDEGSLEPACREVARVARCAVVVGVPYRQDLRYGESKCSVCGRINPPWGHVNTFDERRIAALFHGLAISELTYVGQSRARTNWLSASLMRFAGNPFGTYHQDEPCVHCGAQLEAPPRRRFMQRVATRAAFTIDRVQQVFTKGQPDWVHARFEKVAALSRGRPD
jgi:hypothetical protein